MPVLKTQITSPLLEVTRHFYQSVLRLVVVDEWDEPNDRGVILALAHGEREALLEIHHGPDTADFSGVSLQFRVDDLERFVATLPAGTSYRGPTPRPWGSTYLYLEDPNRIRIVVYEEG